MRDRGARDRERRRHDGRAGRVAAREDRRRDVVDVPAGRGMGDGVRVDDVRAAGALQRQVHPGERIHAQVDNGPGAAVLVQEARAGVEVGVPDDGQREVGKDALDGPEAGQHVRDEAPRGGQVARPHGLHEHDALRLGVRGEPQVLRLVHDGRLLEQDVARGAEGVPGVLVVAGLRGGDVDDVVGVGGEQGVVGGVDGDGGGVGDMLLGEPAGGAEDGAGGGEGDDFVVDGAGGVAGQEEVFDEFDGDAGETEEGPAAGFGFGCFCVWGHGGQATEASAMDWSWDLPCYRCYRDTDMLRHC